MKRQACVDSEIWVTLPQLAEILGVAIPLLIMFLGDMGLRRYDSTRRRYVPTQRAWTQNYSSSVRRHKRTIYLWHKLKLQELFHTMPHVGPLSALDAQHRNTARRLASSWQARQQGQRTPPLDLLYDVLLSPDMSTILAMLLIEDRQQQRTYALADQLIELLHESFIDQINQELRRLDANIQLPETDSHIEALWGDSGSYPYPMSTQLL